MIQVTREEDEAAEQYVLSVKASAGNAVVSSATCSVSVVQKVVLDRRHGRASSLGVTEDAAFEFDMRKDDVVRWCIVSSDMDANQKDVFDCKKRWPQANPLRYSQQTQKFELHVLACCSTITQLSDCVPQH